MTAHDHDRAHAGNGPVELLERMDNWAHIVVAAFFLLMTTTVILHMGFIFVRQLPLIMPASESPVAVTEAPAPRLVEQLPDKPHAAASAAAVTAEPAKAPEDPFVRNSLELLSNILFVVILLELLRTIITYLQTHNIQAIMQEFLVVGIISSVRKILLVGAESSLVGSKGMDFIQESVGVTIDIIGIMMLIGGLVLLKRAFGEKAPEHGIVSV